ncbi:oligopeptide ABC transporter ATP-binding protein OppD [Spiroplasma taiwanense]|uniref:Oligopeptide ABC transporter ATP-binding protein n=1 Tax=Spiroplasma taiwanense CT-1 TaxID=1276220 RepID=S5LUI8_9MOLU|nr:oligopeptide ABC transporter ATP-binding protein OppD [Spiroplasma taiwanense]AGR41459.1 oligopeptide ABC transporter ATP-binding protein [Spiroplasma taiwanense CT-1]
MKNKILSIRNIEVKFQVRSNFLTAIRNVSLDIYDKEIIAIVGESGSGKSVITKTFTGMLENNGWISDGSIVYSPNFESQNDKNTYFKKPIDLVNFQNQLMEKTTIKSIIKITKRKIRKIDKKIKKINGIDSQKTENQILEIGRKITEQQEKIFFSKKNNASIKIDRLTFRLNNLEELKKISSNDEYKNDIISDLQNSIELLKIDISKIKHLNFFERRKISIMIEVLKKSYENNVELNQENIDFINNYFINKKHFKKFELELKDLIDNFINEKKIDEDHLNNILLDWSKIKNFSFINKIKAIKEIRKLRGKTISTIFQDPMTSLNPLLSVGFQISEILIKQLKMSRSSAKKEAIELLRKVGIPDPEKRYKDIPGRYSGGMRQRVVIAIALACRPKILICDEPTTALDVTIQAQILDLIKELQEEYKFTVIFITHDLGVVAKLADRIAVMYAGQIIEIGTTEDIFYDPKHPYTWALLYSLPQLGTKGDDLFFIKGTPPSLFNKIEGDAFASRSNYAMEVDLNFEPPMFKVSETHFAKTWLLDKRAPKVEKPKEIINLKSKMKE